MNEKQIQDLAVAIATAVAKALNESKVEKAEPTPSALAKSEQDLWRQGRDIARRFNAKGGRR